MARIVRGACPHDCPDTCAMQVTVENGADDARPGVLVAPMGWWNGDYRGGRSGQATTSQALTARGNAPTFNDNRVEVERGPP
jgi:hypothetical protein